MWGKEKRIKGKIKTKVSDKQWDYNSKSIRCWKNSFDTHFSYSRDNKCFPFFLLWIFLRKHLLLKPKIWPKKKQFLFEKKKSSKNCLLFHFIKGLISFWIDKNFFLGYSYIISMNVTVKIFKLSFVTIFFFINFSKSKLSKQVFGMMKPINRIKLTRHKIKRYWRWSEVSWAKFSWFDCFRWLKSQSEREVERTVVNFINCPIDVLYCYVLLLI